MPNYDELLEQVVELRTRGTDLKSLAEKQSLLAVLDELRESNPMLGLRGCRLGLKFPEIYAMQVKAIARAASRVSAEGMQVHPEIMVPLVGHGREMARLREALESTIKRYTDETGTEIEYKIGAMIELPRAALTANEIAETAEFFSFGTNDLTQTVFGFSRD
ncbi:MAG: pyruvate, phosphate dikinase, partial [Acidobacteria bacterium]|nr:pyruvate, phosphate dikinase [Acidobacteriota bacterium]